MQVFKNVCLLLIFLSYGFGLRAQEGILVAGLGPTYETNNSIVGVNGRFYYGPNDSFCFGPEISFFPYQEINEEYESSIIDLNLNAHYIFELNHKVGVYPISGLNYTIEKERLITDSNGVLEEKEIGLNYGVGGHYEIGKTFFFLEFKGIVGKLSDEFITLGIIFNLSKNKEDK